MIEIFFKYIFGYSYADVLYLLILITVFICLLKKLFHLSEFSVSRDGINIRFLESSEESPNSEGSKVKLKSFKKGLKSLPQDVFKYFCNSFIWQHMFLTPHDLSVFEKMMSDEEFNNRGKWFTNWNRQDFWDIDFRLIQKLVNQNKKDMEKLEKQLKRDLQTGNK